MEGSTLPAEGIQGHHGDAQAQLILEDHQYHHSLPTTHAMTTITTEYLDANGDQLQVKRAKFDNANIATGFIGQDEISLEEQVFSNHVLLEEIFKHATFEDLKSHRQLNQLWNLKATKAILNQFSMIPIKLSPKNTCLDVNCTNKWSLDKFQLLVEQSRIFPCNAFLIEEPDFLKDSLLDFFTTHGSLIKSIVYEKGRTENVYEVDPNKSVHDVGPIESVHDVGPNKSVHDAGPIESVHEVDPNESVYIGPNVSVFETDRRWSEIKLSEGPTCTQFIQLLADHLPNLEVLNLKICPSSGLQIESSSHDDTAKKELKRLQTVYISDFSSEEMLGLLLNRSKNLKNINARGDSCLLKLVKLNAIHLLYKICFTFHGDSISFYQKIVTPQLNCKNIEVDWVGGSQLHQADLPKVGRILTNAFHSSSGTLRTLYLKIPLGHVPGLRFATCPKVARIVVQYINWYIPTNRPAPLVSPFPLDFNLEATFPNLREFEFSYNFCGDFPLFPESSLPLLFVRSLTICCPDETEIPTRWLKQFCQLFPNITYASLSNISDSDFGLISTFRFLKKLEITLVIVGEKFYEDFVRVDSLLTGFSRETVRRIYYQSGTSFNVNVEDTEGLRVTGSVADLKNLTELVIKIFRCEYWPGIDDRIKTKQFVVRSGLDEENPVLKMGKNVTISHVSRKFCFDMCPKLQSNVIFKFKNCSYLMPQDDD